MTRAVLLNPKPDQGSNPVNVDKIVDAVNRITRATQLSSYESAIQSLNPRLDAEAMEAVSSQRSGMWLNALDINIDAELQSLPPSPTSEEISNATRMAARAILQLAWEEGFLAGGMSYESDDHDDVVRPGEDESSGVRGGSGAPGAETS